MTMSPEEPPQLSADLSAAESSSCPRCQCLHVSRFYGPCESCRADLRSKMAGVARTVEVAEYEPKMNVTPNAVALKDD